MIKKYWEMTCDICGCACHYRGTIKDAEQMAQDEGWIITSKGKHFDSTECYEESKTVVQQSLSDIKTSDE